MKADVVTSMALAKGGEWRLLRHCKSGGHQAGDAPADDLKPSA